MEIRVGLILSALVVFVGIVYALWASGNTPPDADWIVLWIVSLFGGMFLGAIWLGVLIVRLTRPRERGPTPPP